MSQLFDSGKAVRVGVEGGGTQTSIMRLYGSAFSHIIQLDFHSSHIGFSESRQDRDGVMELSSK